MHSIPFLSEQSEEKHRTYLTNLKLKLSILRKSDSRIADIPLRELACSRRYSFADAALLAREILLHESYFASFLSPSSFSFAKGYRDADFRYRILSSDDEKSSFIVVSFSWHKPAFYYISSLTKMHSALLYCPNLAIDLCEHAYYADFGFDRHSYLRACVASLDFSALENPKNT